MKASPATPRRSCHLVELTALPGLRYSAPLGCLEAAAKQDRIVADAYSFAKHIYFPLPGRFAQLRADFLADLKDPSVVAFTVYCWNRSQSVALARDVKRLWPYCWVVLGGNDVSHQTEQLFHEAPWVDVLVHGEGELTFRSLLRALLDTRPDLATVPGLSFASNGRVCDSSPAGRIVHLAELASPVLSGVFPDEAFSETRMLVYETNRGCPYSCAFCYWGGATNSKVREFPLDRVKAELDYIVQRISAGTTLFIADANFGILRRDIDIAQYLVDLAVRHGKRFLVMTNWAKNTNDRILEIATMLYRAGLTGAITLSTQSFDPEVLTLAQRSNIRLEHYRSRQIRFRELGVPTYTDLIWGLPGESLDSFGRGVEEVLVSGGSPVIYPLLLLNNTAYKRESFRRAQGLQVRCLPIEMGNPEVAAEMVVQHHRMTFEEWIEGLELRLALSLFYKALLRSLLWYFHTETGTRFVDMCRLLGKYLTSGESPDPSLSTLAQNHSASYRDFHSFDGSLISAELEQVEILEELHYQAILHHFVVSPDRCGQLLADAVGYLRKSVPATAELPDRTVREALSLDLAASSVLRASIAGRVQESPFRVTNWFLDLLQRHGQLSIDRSITADPDGRIAGVLRVPAARTSYPFSAYALSIWHGSGHPLKDGVLEWRRRPSASVEWEQLANRTRP